MISQYCQISPVFLGLALELSAGLDASGAAEADGHLVVVHDDRHCAASLAVHEHARERRGVLLDVEILERDVPPLKVVTGGLRIRSGVFAEDGDHAALSH
jgi:hypothetical protein